MSILSRIKGLFGITFGVPGANTYESSMRWTMGLPLVDGAMLTEPYAQSAAVAIGVGNVAADAAAIGWELYPPKRTKDDDKIEDHPLLDLFDRPAMGVSGYDLWVATFVYRKLFGEVYWYYPMLRVGRTDGLESSRRSTGEIMVLDPRGVRRLDNGLRYQMHGQDFAVSPEFLTQFRRFNPYDPAHGLSEIAPLGVELKADYNASKLNRDVVGQGGVPTVLLKNTQQNAMPVGPEERKAFVDRLDAENARRKAFGMLPAGWEPDAIGMTPQEMNFRELREYSRELTLGVLGVPPFQAGVLENANYANAREQKDVYWHGTINRLLTETQAVLNADFLPKIGVRDVELWPCWEKVKALTEDLGEKADTGAKLFALGFTRRQINERLELGFDVDDMEDADTSYLPFNVVPAEFVNEPPEPAPMPGEEIPPPAKGSLAGKEEKRRALVWRNIVSRTRDIEVRFDSMLRRHMREIRDETLENVNGMKGWRAAHCKAADDLLFDLQAAVKRLIAKSAPLHRAAIQRGGDAVILDLGIAIEFQLTDPRIMGKIVELSRKITRIDETIERELRENLAEGLAAGESPRQLAARVRASMTASQSRSMTIARTETGFAFNTGRNEAMRQAGVRRHEWLSARDPSVRDTHAEEDGSVVMLGEAFPNTHLLYPLDPSGPPGEVINCRCVAVPVIEEAN